MTRQQPFAVLLNPHARRVNSQVRGRVEELVDPEHVYVSESLGRADELIEHIVDRGYGTVFSGGGDGTAHRLFDGLPAQDWPRVGILRFGTGNGLAQMVSSGNPFCDLRTHLSNPSQDSYRLGLCEAEGVRFAFAGIGLDAAILNDYNLLRRSFGAFFRSIQSLGGYLLATFGITAPRLISRRIRGIETEVRVTNLGHASRIEVGPDGGRVTREYGPGDVLYEGPIRGSLFGTCPYYGYNLKVLPFAGVDPNRFHLRLVNVPTHELVLSARKVWKGTLMHGGLHDFHVDNVHLEFSEPMPYQLGGEPRGMRDEITITMSGRAVDLVRFI